MSFNFNNQSFGQQVQGDVPQTILNYGTRVSANLNFLKGKGRVMSAALDFTVVGLNNSPYILYATPKFNIASASVEVQKNIFDVKTIFIQPSYIVEELESNYCDLPIWIANFKRLDYLRLNHIYLNRLIVIKNLPIRFLSLINIKANGNNYRLMAEDISKLTHLQCILYDDSMPKQLLKLLMKLNSKYSFYYGPDKAQAEAFGTEIYKDI